jgi:probable lipoprotein NlpC
MIRTALKSSCWNGARRFRAPFEEKNEFIAIPSKNGIFKPKPIEGSQTVPEVFMARFRLALCFLLVSPLFHLAAEPPLAGVSGGEARTQLIEAAQKYRGLPYRYGGMDSRGLDCSGLVFLSFRDSLQVEVPRRAEDLYHWTERLERDQIQPGDLVFFQQNGRVFHVGIYIGEGWFFHAASSGPKTGVMYSRLDESFWSRNYAGAGRALP